MNKRTLSILETQFTHREEDGRKYIEGYFAVFGAKYWLWDSAYETIDPGAFDLVRDKDIRALVNHDTTLVLGRTTVGTLTLRIDERGLFGSIEINQADQDAVNLYERVKRGDVSQCSFGFEILSQSIESADGMPTVFHLQEVRLYEVSVCTFPAYEDTAVVARARKKELEDIDKRRADAWRADMLKKLHKERS